MKNEKTIRALKVLYILSFILDLTIVGAFIGVPLFLVLWALQYIFLGKGRPFYVFNTNKRLSKLFSKKETIQNRVKQIYDIQFASMALTDSRKNFLIEKMVLYYEYFVFEVEKILDKYGLQFDTDEIIPIFQLIDCEVIILASKDFILEHSLINNKEEAEKLLPKPNENLLEFIANNKHNLSPFLVEQRLDEVRKIIIFVEPCAKRYEKDLELIIDAIINHEIPNNRSTNVTQENNDDEYEISAEAILGFTNQKIKMNKKDIIDHFEDYILYKVSKNISNLTDIDETTKTELEKKLYECFIAELDKRFNGEVVYDYAYALQETQIRAIFYAILKTTESFFQDQKFAQEVYHQYDDEIAELAKSGSLNNEKLVAKSLQLFNPAISSLALHYKSEPITEQDAINALLKEFENNETTQTKEK
ncbi:hypothetical protein [Campylobacter mucosalis]|uniref:Uncharacterized protein n=1 Tax=Campylobacter mucosalis CCUG 21559 TaxID=1032067 RepID=A0A6G5QFG9_9BACT|nr:hypothetical protein [Campylobacter mucosalis]QCD44420.1 hypothetical protein CMUC_0621 [Campylobacter mucosalis CCUG 21559]